MGKPTSKSSITINHQLEVDPADGQLTVKSVAEVNGVAKGEVSYTISEDNTHTTTQAGEVNVGRFKVGISESNSHNDDTGATSHARDSTLSMERKIKLGDTELSGKATCHILTHSEGQRPTALDPNMVFTHESITTGASVSGSMSNKHIAIKHDEPLAKIGGVSLSIENATNEKTVYADTVGTMSGVLVPDSRSIFEYSPTELYEHQQRLGVMAENYKINQNHAEKGNDSYIFYKDKLTRVEDSQDNLKLVEVYVVPEHAEKALSEGDTHWQKTEYDEASRVLYQHTDGTGLYVGRTTQHAIYKRPDDSIEIINYTDPHDDINQSYQFKSSEQNTQIHVAENGWVLVDNGNEGILSNGSFYTHIPEDINESQLVASQITVDLPNNEITNEIPNQPSSMYQIQPRDSLTLIAERQNTTIDALLAVNPAIKDPNTIYIGDELIIPANHEVKNAAEGRSDVESQVKGQSTDPSAAIPDQSKTDSEDIEVLELLANAGLIDLNDNDNTPPSTPNITPDDSGTEIA